LRLREDFYRGKISKLRKSFTEEKSLRWGKKILVKILK
jgi:hypothetical protein